MQASSVGAAARSRTVLVMSIGFLVSVLLTGIPALADYNISGYEQLTGFGPTQSGSYSGSAYQSISFSDSDGIRAASFLASPFEVSTYASENPSGINSPTASASSSGTTLTFAQSPALSSLAAPGQSTIDLLVHFQVASQLFGTDGPGIFNQSSQDIGGSVQASTTLYNSSSSGSANITNGDSDYTTSSSGFLSNIALDGSTSYTDVALPIEISATDPSADIVTLSMSDGASGLSLNFLSYGGIDILLPVGSDFVTLQDGTPVSTLGVTYAVAPVPEPTSLTIAAIGAVTLLRRRAKVAPSK